LHAGLRRRRAWVQIIASTLSGKSLRQTVHTHHASVHQAAKLVAALLRVAGITVGLTKVMAAYRWIYDSNHLQADCQELGSAAEAAEPYVWQSSLGYLLYCSSSLVQLTISD